MLFNNKKCSNCASYYDPTLKKCPICNKSNELYDQRRIPDSVVFFHPAAQIGLFLAGFSFVGMLVSEIISTIIFKGLPDRGLADALEILFVYILMLSALLTISLSARASIFIEKFKRYKDYLFGLAYAGAIILTGVIINTIQGFIYQATNGNQEAAESLITNYPIIAIFLVCLLGPICEELTYRVGLYSFLRRINKILAIIVTTIVFALIHYDFSAKDYIAELWALPSYLTCGLILALAYEHRGPACSITAHVTYNIVALILVIIGKAYG
ncbi:MAG: CPBP family intramembrane metalloprotease [Bacilli bacterium]|nr:CPBP family intramembrane metalloprotease [Bacilli bacterium]